MTALRTGIHMLLGERMTGKTTAARAAGAVYLPSLKDVPLALASGQKTLATYAFPSTTMQQLLDAHRQVAEAGAVLFLELMTGDPLIRHFRFDEVTEPVAPLVISGLMLASLPSAPIAPMPGLQMVLEERRRQIEQEGWTAEHDDRHAGGQLAIAAACYAVHERWGGEGEPIKVHVLEEDDHCRDAWPWDRSWDKRRKHPRLRRLVIAGALIVAEIDRLLRLGRGGDR